MKDFRSFYITWPGHPKYKKNKIIVDDVLRVIINKMEMILFSNKGDFIGDVNFGADLETYIWSTNVSSDFIKDQIREQFDAYIPELVDFNYTLNVNFIEGDFEDALAIDITISDVGVKALFRRQ